MLKVLRRLELQALEQQCWCFLMGVVDKNNCERLHELADIFDCPALKLSAWKTLQETMPGYAAHPSQVLRDDGHAAAGRVIRGNGLTGPCDMEVIRESAAHITGAAGGDGDGDGVGDDDHLAEDRDDAEHAQPPVLLSLEEHDLDDDDGMDISVQDEQDGLYRNLRVRKHMDAPPHPCTLPRDATATEVVSAWAKHLQFTHWQCTMAKYCTEAEEADAEAQAQAADHEHDYQQQQRHRHRVDWRAELKRFYIAIGMPSKISELDTIMQSWRDKEDVMLESLIDKYSDSIPSDLLGHMHRLIDMMRE